MTDDSISTRIRTYANVVTHRPSVGIPCTEDEWQRYCYMSFCWFWSELAAEILPREFCDECGRDQKVGHGCIRDL